MRPSGRNEFNKSIPEYFPENAQEALDDSWEMEDIYPRPNMRSNLHGYWMSQGYYVADMPFTRRGRLVARGQYALWIKKIPIAEAVAS